MGTNIFKPVIASSGGTSGGGGAKNYLAAITTSNGVNTGNGDIELGSTTGWSLGNNSTFSNGLLTGTTPTFGSGASGNLSISAISSGVLAGSFSMQFANSGTGAAGDFFASDAFNIDTEDQAKVLTFKFYYKVTVNPANGTFSGTNTNSFGVAFWDVTNSQWIFPAGVFSMTQSSGVGLATGTFQTTSNSTQYRMVIYQANTGGGAITLVFDDFNVGPQTAPIGPVMTDPVAYTPTFTGLGTVTAISVKSWREGKNLLCQGVFTTGTVAGSNMTMTLGFNGANGSVTSDSTLPGSSPLVYLGTCVSGSTTATAIRNFDILGTASLTTVSFSYLQDSGTASPLATQLGTAMQSSTAHSFSFIIPIAGWSSNVQMSNDTDTRVVAASYSSTGQSVSNATPTTINLTTIIIDTYAAVSSNQFKVPVSGIYKIIVNSGCDANVNTGQVRLIARKNASQIGNPVQYLASTTLALYGNGTWLTPANAGDLLDAQITQSNGTTETVTSTVSFERLSGPAVIAATESVNARYFASATAISGSLATVVWTTKDFDSHNAMALGLYTIPVSGKYQFNANIQVTGTIALNSTIDLQVQKNSSAVSEFQSFAGGAMTAQNAQLSDTIPCLAGDVIRSQLSSSATLPVIASGNTKVFFSIERVGN